VRKAHRASGRKRSREVRCQTIESAANRASGAGQRRPVDDVIDLRSESAAVTNKELYLLPAIADQQLDFPAKSLS